MFNFDTDCITMGRNVKSFFLESEIHQKILSLLKSPH